MDFDNKKTVLVLGAGRGQTGLIRTAKKRGLRVEVATIEGDYPGLPLADEINIVDIKDKDAVAELARMIGADAVISAGTDLALPAMGLACERNKLPGPTLAAALISSDKALMKEAFEKGGVRTARHVVVRNEDEAEKAADKLRLPLIVKAIDLQGSIGINVVFEREFLRDAFRKTMRETKQDHCIVEEYLDGYEVSATAMISDGEVLFVLPTGDVRYGENGECPIGHYIPLDCGEGVLGQVKEQVKLGIRAIGLDNCAVNADLMIMDGKAYVIELTGRLGGNSIPEITSEYFQMNIYDLILDVALGDYEAAGAYDFSDRDKRVSYGQMIISDKDGVLGSTNIAANDCTVSFFIKEGDKINKYKGPNDCVGQIVAVKESKEECEAAIRNVVGEIEIL